MKLAYYNKRPPKPQYIERIFRILNTNKSQSLSQIQKASGLTKTQVGCSLDYLLLKSAIDVEIKDGARLYSLPLSGPDTSVVDLIKKENQ